MIRNAYSERNCGLDIEYLKEFITLADKLNFSQAASAHYITQPALTKHIQILENELGADLFYRSRQAVRLTPMGELFLPEAEKVVNAWSDAALLIRKEKAQYSSSLSISFIDPLIRKQLPQWLKILHEKYPGIHVALAPADTLNAAELLANHTCDVAATLQLPNFTHPDFETYSLYQDPICLFAPKTHRFADYKSLFLKDLNDEVVLLPSMDFAGEFRQFVEKQLKRSGARVTFTRCVNSAREAFMLMNAGVGVWIAPQHQQIFSPEDTVIVPILDPGFYANVVLMWPKTDPNPNVSTLIHIISSDTLPEING